MDLNMELGAKYLGDGKCTFRVWAPFRDTVDVHFVEPSDRLIRLEKSTHGYHLGTIDKVGPGHRYFFRLDGGTERPDPASRYQPLGVHGPSEVVESGFSWKDRTWRGILLEDYVIYELHVGTFTELGTFDAVWTHLDDIQDLGATAIELMPVAQFPGSRNWGYDGVYPYAVQNSYGGPEGLKLLVDECHRRGMAVVLDVVYNHLGPEGNYLWDFGPYFTERYRTPWGSAVNFDGAYSNGVRDYFVSNALYWVTELHIDALRLDAVHGIFDFSAVHILQEIGDAVHRRARSLGRRVYVIPESDLNDSRLIRSPELGGYGLDAQWNDDFHHALHTLLTGEDSGYYQDFGNIGHLTRSFQEGYVYSGKYSTYRKRNHGNATRGLSPRNFVVFAQNHDQVGNRCQSDRLTGLVSYEALKLAAGTVLLSPFIPLLFMGEEYGEPSPFPYFISHGDPDLIEAVRKGRIEEFGAFGWLGKPPDPESESTFQRAKLNHALRRKGRGGILFHFHKTLIGLRRELRIPPRDFGDYHVTSLERYPACVLTYGRELAESAIIMHFGGKHARIDAPFPSGRWGKRLDSAEEQWAGPGSNMPLELLSHGAISLEASPHSLVVYARKDEI